MTRDRADSSRILLGDIALAVLFLGMAIAEIWILDHPVANESVKVIATVLTSVMAGTLVFRSSHTLPAFVVNGAAIVALTVIGYSSDVYQYSNLVLLYSVGVVTSDRTSVVALLASLNGIALYFVRFGQPLIFGAFTMLLWALGWTAGRSTRARHVRADLEHQGELAREMLGARELGWPSSRNAARWRGRSTTSSVIPST